MKLEAKIYHDVEIPIMEDPVIVKLKHRAMVFIMFRDPTFPDGVTAWDDEWYYGLDQVEWWMPIPGWDYKGEIPQDHSLTHEELLEQLKGRAKSDCAGCDGTGIFYGNVAICGCVNQTIQEEHEVRLKDKLQGHIATSTNLLEQMINHLAPALPSDGKDIIKGVLANLRNMHKLVTQ